MTWMDVLALATLAVAFACGWRAGLVAEFFDVGSLVAAGTLAWLWSPPIAGALPPTWPLSDASRHFLAFWALLLVIYLILRVLGLFVAAGRGRGQPIGVWIKGIGGGLIGAAKVLATLFVVLYLALFLQIDPQLRDTLRHSLIAMQFDARYPPINDALFSMTPAGYQKAARPYLHDHRL